MAIKEETCTSDIISILYKASGRYVSGEYLSQCLGITRTAVWKRIAALRKEGYDIEASTKKGYRLCSFDFPYGKIAIQLRLNTHTFGHALEFYQQIDSTNRLLKQLASEGVPEGTVVIADSQSAGRGRLGRSWLSAPGKGIWMSLLLRPKLHPSEVQILTLAASVAVCRALEFLEIPGMGIKWPNDIMIGGKKVCGILTELSAEAERIAWVVLGIGLNVNHLQQDFPPEISDVATSLRLNKDPDRMLDRGELASKIVNELEKVYDSYLDIDFGCIIEEWKRWNLTLGKKVRLSSHNGESIIATACDILPDGRLKVKKDDGTILEVLSGEITLRDV